MSQHCYAEDRMHMNVKGKKGKKGLYDDNYTLIFLVSFLGKKITV